MRKTFFIIPLLALLSVTGCKKDGKESTELGPNLSVNTHKINAIAGIDTVSFKIYTNIDWTITYTDEWCKPLELSGDSVTVVKVAIEKNENMKLRTAEISVHYELDSEKKEEVVTITQDPEPCAIILEPDTLRVSDMGGSFTIKASTNIPFDILNIDEYDWIERISTYAMVDEDVMLEIQPNTDVTYRIAKLVFKQQDTTTVQTLMIYQYGVGSLETDKQALTALYNAAGGSGWTKKWDTGKPVEEWYGVTVGETSSGKRVTELRLSANNLTGTIPEEFVHLDFLKILWLDHNNLTGPIPAKIENCIYLEYLYLHNNLLTGTIPGQVGNLENLNRLYLSHNQLEGEIPETIAKIPYLYALGLNNNNLTGSLPADIGSMSTLQLLFVNGNRLTGTIPNTYKNNKYWLYWQPQINIAPQQDGYGFDQ